MDLTPAHSGFKATVRFQIIVLTTNIAAFLVIQGLIPLSIKYCFLSVKYQKVYKKNKINIIRQISGRKSLLSLHQSYILETDYFCLINGPTGALSSVPCKNNCRITAIMQLYCNPHNMFRAPQALFQACTE